MTYILELIFDGKQTLGGLQRFARIFRHHHVDDTHALDFGIGYENSTSSLAA